MLCGLSLDAYTERCTTLFGLALTSEPATLLTTTPQGRSLSDTFVFRPYGLIRDRIEMGLGGFAPDCTRFSRTIGGTFLAIRDHWAMI